MKDVYIPGRLATKTANRNEAHVFMERLPKDVIVDIKENPLARSLLHKQYRYVASQDWLADNVIVTTSAKDTAHLIAASPQSWTRAVALWTGQFPYKDLVGGTIMVKGCSISGESFENEQVNEYGSDIPWGFFGTREAHQEEKVSNQLLLTGARVALPLGYVVMDPKRLAAELEQRIEGAEIRKRVLGQLKKVEENDDYPALYFRVAGVRERLSNFHHQPGRRRFMYEMARGASLLLAEEELNPGKIDQYLFPFQGEVGSEEVVPTLMKIAARKTLTDVELDNFFFLLSGIVRANAAAIEAYYLFDSQPKYGNLGVVASHSKDICLGFITQDFEQADPPSKTGNRIAYRNYQEYRSNMLHRLTAFLNEQFIGRYLPGYLGAGFGKRVKGRLEDLIFP